MPLGFFPNWEIHSLTPLQQKLAESKLRMTDIAKAAEVRIQDVSHFVRGRKNRVGRGHWRKINNWMIENKFAEPPRPKEKCRCPICHRSHTKGKSTKNSVYDD
jgi:hypothetical protein